MPDRAVKLGVLDFGWVSPGRSAAESLSDSFTAARRAEAVGYSRVWLGEHHLEGHTSGSPQVLAGVLAASTRRIRVGIGAMLLHYWSPLKLAEDFRLLEALFGRVDLGVARGRADDARSHLALLDGRPATDGMLSQEGFQAKLEDLLGHLRGALPDGHPHQGAPVIPDLPVSPEVWVCGAETAAVQAARTGTRFCCTLFHGRRVPPATLARYRAEFRPSPELEAPHAAIAVCGVCADTEGEARALRAAFPHRNYLPSFAGAPEQCAAAIRGLCSEYDVGEAVILDMAPHGPARVRSLELMAQGLGLVSNLSVEAHP